MKHMAISSMKHLIRRSVKQKSFGAAVTSTQVVLCANEFLVDILPVGRAGDAKVMSYRDGVLKIWVKNTAVRSYIREFDQELRTRFMEKFHDLPISSISFHLSSTFDQDPV